MPNPVVHFEIQSNQAEKLQKFYADIFGWHVNADNEFNYGLVHTYFSIDTKNCATPGQSVCLHPHSKITPTIEIARVVPPQLRGLID